MKLLHTSDWHLGGSLFTKSRHSEHQRFLDWLLELIDRERIDCLLVAGDIFDATTPNNPAQGLYFDFLARAARSCCRHLVIVAGNHDSPSLLEAPRDLLKSLDIHVIGTAEKTPEKEVIALRDSSGNLELVICAVPYLRERDVRDSRPGQSQEEKQRQLAEGTRKHYQTVCEEAVRLSREGDRTVPIVATGHLLTLGGKTEDGDGVRDLYVGNLGAVGADIFPAVLDYVALGHLHVPQRVGGSERVRYSGSPIPMGFGEANQRKLVLLVDLADSVQIREIAVPRFQRLHRIRGDWERILAESASLKGENESLWLEIDYDGEELIVDLRARLEQEIADSSLEVLRLRNSRLSQGTSASQDRLAEGEQLAELSVFETFEHFLAADGIAEQQREPLRIAYREIIAKMSQEENE